MPHNRERGRSAEKASLPASRAGSAPHSGEAYLRWEVDIRRPSRQSKTSGVVSWESRHQPSRHPNDQLISQPHSPPGQPFHPFTIHHIPLHPHLSIYSLLLSIPFSLRFTHCLPATCLLPPSITLLACALLACALLVCAGPVLCASSCRLSRSSARRACWRL